MHQRRTILRAALALTAAIGVPALAAGARQERRLHLYNTHTGESLRRVFWAGGAFVPDALAAINHVLRDHRDNSVVPIDPHLLLLLERVCSQFDADPAVHVISGYRSPASNALLAEQGDGVARHSLHCEGRAIDVRLPGHALASLRRAALRLAAGGVGYYPQSQFVHIDSGRPRRW